METPVPPLDHPLPGLICAAGSGIHREIILGREVAVITALLVAVTVCDMAPPSLQPLHTYCVSWLPLCGEVVAICGLTPKARRTCAAPCRPSRPG